MRIFNLTPKKSSVNFERPTVEKPEIPKFFGKEFRIKLCGNYSLSNNNVDAVHNIYRGGLEGIESSLDICSILNYHFGRIKTHGNEFLAETIESLIDDFNGVDNSYYTIGFSLNKSQLLEFVELCDKAGQGLII